MRRSPSAKALVARKHLRRLHLRPGRGLGGQGGAVVGKPDQPCALVEPHAERERGTLQAPGQQRRMHGAADVLRPDAAEIARRGDLGAHAFAVEQGGIVAVLQVQPVLGRQCRHMGGIDRHGQLPAPFGVAVDAVAGDGVEEAAHVVVAEPFQLANVPGEDARGVRQAVHDRGGDDAAGAAGGAVRDLVRLDQHHVEARVLLLGLDAGPQAGEAAADDQQVAARRRFQRRP